MKFKANKNGMYSIFGIGFTIPVFLSFMVFTIIGDPTATLIFAIIGGISLIVTVIFWYQMMQEIKDISDSDLTEIDKASGTLYQVAFFLTLLFLVLGNIFILL